jgi:hypothetical protein
MVLSSEAEKMVECGEEMTMLVIAAVCPRRVRMGSISVCLRLDLNIPSINIPSITLPTEEWVAPTYFCDMIEDASTDHTFTVLSSPPEASTIPGP